MRVAKTPDRPTARPPARPPARPSARLFAARPAVAFLVRSTARRESIFTQCIRVEFLEPVSLAGRLAGWLALEDEDDDGGSGGPNLGIGTTSSRRGVTRSELR